MSRIFLRTQKGWKAPRPTMTFMFESPRLCAQSQPGPRAKTVSFFISKFAVRAPSTRHGCVIQCKRSTFPPFYIVLYLSTIHLALCLNAFFNFSTHFVQLILNTWYIFLYFPCILEVIYFPAFSFPAEISLCEFFTWNCLIDKML